MRATQAISQLSGVIADADDHVDRLVNVVVQRQQAEIRRGDFFSSAAVSRNQASNVHRSVSPGARQFIRLCQGL